MRLAARRLAERLPAWRDVTDSDHAGPRAAAAAAPPGWPVHTPGSPGPTRAPARAGNTTAPPPRLGPGTHAAGSPAAERAAAAPVSVARIPWPVPAPVHARGAVAACSAGSPR